MTRRRWFYDEYAGTGVYTGIRRYRTAEGFPLTLDRIELGDGAAWYLHKARTRHADTYSTGFGFGWVYYKDAVA